MSSQIKTFIEYGKIFLSLIKLRFMGVPKKSNYTVISLALGQQSTAMYLMSCTGVIARADFAIFVAPGSESIDAYKHLQWLKKWSKANNGIPIFVTGKKSLYTDLPRAAEISGQRIAPISTFTKNINVKVGVPQCHRKEEYETLLVSRFIRRAYGLNTRMSMPLTELWLNTTLEEIERATFAQTNWLVFVYPFLNIKAFKRDFERVKHTQILRGIDCQKWIVDKGYPLAPKSECTFCGI